MSGIPTWHERAMAHPDHQSGMVSEDMLRARMCEEIADLRAEVERLQGLLKGFSRDMAEEIERLRAEKDLDTSSLARERDEARAEVERQAAEVFALMRAWRADKERLDEALKALEAKP